MRSISLFGDPAFTGASYARQGGLIAVKAAPHSSLTVFPDPIGDGEALPKACIGRASKFIIRTYLVNDAIGRLQIHHELVYTMGFGPFVYRHDLTNNRPRPALKTDVKEVTCLQESSDGRYLAVGGSSGKIEVWNFDLGPAHLHYRSPDCDKGMVAALCFSNTNMELFASLSCGELQHHEIHRNECQTMESALRWAVYAIATRSESGGIAFAGDGKRVWFLNMTCQHEPHYFHTSPFRLARRKNYLGDEFMVVAAMPGVRLSHLDTGVGPMIHHLRFVTDNELFVVGDHRAELWNLADQRIIDQADYPAYKLVGAGVHEHHCHIALQS